MERWLMIPAFVVGLVLGLVIAIAAHVWGKVEGGLRNIRKGD